MKMEEGIIMVRGRGPGQREKRDRVGNGTGGKQHSCSPGPS